MDRTLELIKLAQNGDSAAKESIVVENVGLIWSVVRKFSNRGYDPEDLFQIGAIGLVKCIEKFDTGFGVKFSTYAVPMIMGEIKRFLRDDGIIKISRPLKEMAIKAKYMQETLQHKTGKVPTVLDLASALETNVEDLVMAMESGLEVESLNSIVHLGDGNPIYLIDKLDQRAEDDDNMVDIIVLKDMISQLEPKERQVILLRYFQDKTQSEVAKEIGISQVQVSRIEKKVIASMREKFADC